MRLLAVCLLVAGCGTTSSDPFLIETDNCSLVNNFLTNGTATPRWTDCRVYWDGSATNILSVQITQPGTMGSIFAPSSGWVLAKVYLPTGSVQRTLTTTPHNVAIDSVYQPLAEDQIAFNMDVGCDRILGINPEPIETMADVGNASVSFSIKLNGTCQRPAGQGSLTYSGGFILTASGASTTSDPSTVVTLP